MSNNFVKLELDQDNRDYSMNKCDDFENKVILNFQGNAIYLNGTKCHFYLSAKIVKLHKEVMIDQMRLKFTPF